VGTNGRSIWIFDDLTPLRDYSKEITGKAAHLFPAQPTHRYHIASSIAERMGHGSAPNPPHGAVLHYYLKEKPKGDVTLQILDAKGNVVRTLTSKEEKDESPPEEGDYSEKEKKSLLPTEAGLHRVVWDLH